MDEVTDVAAEAVSMPEPQAEPSQVSEAPKSEPTPRGSIDRAFAAMEKGETAPVKAEVKPNTVVEESEHGRERNPDGTFKAKAEGEPVDNPEKPVVDATKTTFAEAPTRFSADAKAAWATAPEPVKAEITRAIKELEGGLEQYRQNFEPYKEFDANLKQSGQTFKEVIAHYTGIENKLAQDPIGGLETICQNLGTSLREVAAHVMGQPVDQQASRSEATINELRSEIASLKKEFGTVSTSFKSQQEQALLSKIEQFAADKPRFDELSEDIAFFIDSGRTADLQEAYTLAERLNPAPQVQQPAIPQTPDPAQTRKGQLSTTGAPSSGSNPINRKPPASARDALDRAFAVSGI